MIKSKIFLSIIFLTVILIFTGNQFGNAENNEEVMKEPEDKSVDELVDIGSAYLDQGQYEEALKYFDRALKIDPNDPYVLGYKGDALLDFGKFDEAVVIYKRALEIDPGDVITLANLGYTLSLLERYDEALVYYDKALSIEDDDFITLNNKGKTLFSLGKHDEALVYFDKALDIVPKDIYPLSNKGSTLSQMERYEEALNYFDKVLKIDPNNKTTLYEKGYALSQLDRYEESLDYYDRALKFEPSNVDALVGKAIALCELEKYSKAKNLFDKVLAIEPENKAATKGLKFTSNAIQGKIDQNELEQTKDEFSPEKILLDYTPVGILVQELVPEVSAEEETNQQTSQNNQGPTSDNGGCLIATATYGSELAPQVQQLRELRDNTLLETNSGKNFMNAFNGIYYSFSPIVADYERENPLFKEAVKLAITPMISSLSILNIADMETETEVLGFGISLIVLNIGMYFGIPAFAIWKIKKFSNS